MHSDDMHHLATFLGSGLHLSNNFGQRSSSCQYFCGAIHSHGATCLWFELEQERNQSTTQPHLSSNTRADMSSFDNMNSNVSNAFFKQKVQITELQLDVTEKRRELKALASLLEKAGVKKSKIEKMRAEAKEVARMKRSRDETHHEFITSQPNSSKSSKSIKKVKRVRKHETKRARSA